jgi:hypothetical protein
MNEVIAAPELNTIGTSSGALIMDIASMDSMSRMAEIMASGKSTVPQHLRGSPGDCMAVVMQAVQWKMNPFAVAQKTHVVNGQLGYEAQLVNAVIISSGVIEGRPTYDYFGNWDNVDGKTSKDAKVGVIVSATIKGEAAPRTLPISMGSVGSVRNSPLWVADPKQQIAYLGLKRWSRLHTPDVILGVYTPDEFEQAAQTAQQTRSMGAAEVVAPEAPPELVAAASAAAIKGVTAYQKFWKDAGKDARQLLGAHHEQFKAAAVQADKDRTIEQPAKSNADFVASMDAAAA